MRHRVFFLIPGLFGFLVLVPFASGQQSLSQSRVSERAAVVQAIIRFRADLVRGDSVRISSCSVAAVIESDNLNAHFPSDVLALFIVRAEEGPADCSVTSAGVQAENARRPLLWFAELVPVHREERFKGSTLFVRRSYEVSIEKVLGRFTESQSYVVGPTGHAPDGAVAGWEVTEFRLGYRIHGDPPPPPPPRKPSGAPHG